ncbi:Uncharacterised protein [Vibrio cholerae]|nr:Uncharacterised protein [Vibrio cholerae]
MPISDWLRNSRVNNRPSSPGKLMSSKTRSMSLSSNASLICAPLSASVTW